MTNLNEMHITEETPLEAAIDAWELFLNDQGRSTYTVKAFIGDLNLMSGYFDPVIAVGKLSTQDLKNFLGWLQTGRGVPCSPKSLSRRITSIKSFFRWLTKSGRLSVDPAEPVLQKSVISPLPEVLTPEEESRIIEVVQRSRSAIKADARPYTLLTLLLGTAIKKGECLALNLNHVDLENPKGPRLFIRYSANSSRYKERNIPLTNDWVEAYKEYLVQYTPTQQIFPWSPRRLEYLLEDIGREAGLTKHLSFDMCRWTSALDDWRKGTDRETLRQKMGVSKIQWREISMKLRQLAGES